jgi:hypothetical protein
MVKTKYRTFAPPERAAVEFHVSVRLDLNELTRTLNAKQIAAVMHGVAQVIAAPKPVRALAVDGKRE